MRFMILCVMLSACVTQGAVEQSATSTALDEDALPACDSATFDPFAADPGTEDSQCLRVCCKCGIDLCCFVSC